MSWGSSKITHAQLPSQCPALSEPSANGVRIINCEEMLPSHSVRCESFLRFERNRDICKFFSVNLNFLKRYKETRNSRKKTWARTSHRWWKGLELGAVFLEAQEYLSGGTLAAPPTRLTSSLVPHLSFLLLLMVSLFFSAPPGFFFLTTCASCSLCILASLPLCFLQASVYVCVQTPWEDLLGSPYPIRAPITGQNPEPVHLGYQWLFMVPTVNLWLNHLCLWQWEYIIQTWCPGVRKCFMLPCIERKKLWLEPALRVWK